MAIGRTHTIQPIPTNGFAPPPPTRAPGGRSGISGSRASRRAWWTHANPVAGNSSQLRTRPAPTFGCVQGGNSHQPDPKFHRPGYREPNRALQRACPTQASLAPLRYQVRLAWFGKEEGSNTNSRSG